MKKTLFFLACVSGVLGYLFWPEHSSHPYRLAICSMFKNEASWIKEWIVYHHDVLGVEHFYLYQNDSTDGYEEVLRPFIEKGIVELIPWSSSDSSHSMERGENDTPFVSFQLGAFNDCIKKRALGQAKWVAVIDIDEYIVPVGGINSLYSLLKRAEKKRQGSLHLKWKVFGTSHVDELREGELLVEKMTLRCEDSHSWHILPKLSISLKLFNPAWFMRKNP